MSAKTRLSMVTQAQAYHTAASSHKAWALQKFAEAQDESRTWDSLCRTETELLRALEVERLAQRALRLAEFKYLTFRPLGGPLDRRGLRPGIPKSVRSKP